MLIEMIKRSLAPTPLASSNMARHLSAMRDNVISHGSLGTCQLGCLRVAQA